MTRILERKALRMARVREVWVGDFPVTNSRRMLGRSNTTNSACEAAGVSKTAPQRAMHWIKFLACLPEPSVQSEEFRADSERS